jgi:hypothetical protein
MKYLASGILCSNRKWINSEEKIRGGRQSSQCVHFEEVGCEWKKGVGLQLELLSFKMSGT